LKENTESYLTSPDEKMIQGLLYFNETNLLLATSIKLAVWDLDTGKSILSECINKIANNPISLSDKYTIAYDQHNQIAVSQYDPDGNTFNHLYQLDKHTEHVWALAYDTRKNFLISGSKDKTIILWDLNTRSAIRTFGATSGHTAEVSGITVLKSGLFASSSHDRTVKFWRYDSEESICTNTNHAGWVNRLYIGTRVFGKEVILSADSDKKIDFIDYNGKSLFSLKANSWVYRLAVFKYPKIDYVIANIDGHQDIVLWGYNQDI
jgi:WD40 repeat protein